MPALLVHGRVGATFRRREILTYNRRNDEDEK
jgi:hypothetical protein